MSSPAKLKFPDLHTKRFESSTIKHQFLSNTERFTQETIPLLEIKHQRRTIENDTNVLATRLTNLRKKEFRIKKNIEDIHQRTLEAIEVKAKQEFQLVKND